MQFISPLLWVGGKTMMIKEVLKYFPNKIIDYIEPFIGSGAVGFRLMFDNKINGKIIFNDINKDLITFWQDVKHNNIIKYYPKFNTIEEAKIIYQSIPKFNKKGWELLFQNRLCWSGRENTSFSITRYNLKYYDCLDRVKICEFLLNKYEVIILNQNYLEVIKNFDSDTALFYLDPPYYNVCQNLYKHEKFDHQELALICKKIKGKFILSLNNCDYIKDLFKDFYQVEWEKVYHIRNKNKLAEMGQELLIMNFNPKIFKQLEMEW